MKHKLDIAEQNFLKQTKEINELFENLRAKTLSQGYPEISGFVRLAQTSFEHELFQQIKK